MQTSKMHADGNYSNLQSDKETPSSSSGTTSWQEFPFYLAESRVNVSYVGRDMTISYPAALQQRRRTTQADPH